jgi:lysophospholipase L1-like esterase
VARYAESIKEEAAARGIAVADLWALECACRSTPTDPSPFPPYYRGDNFHPNDEGHRRIADALLRALRPYTVYLPRAQ